MINCVNKRSKFKHINDTMLCYVEQFVQDQIGLDCCTITKGVSFIRVLTNRGIYEDMEEMRDHLLREMNYLFPEFSIEIDVTRSCLEIYSCS